MAFASGEGKADLEGNELDLCILQLMEFHGESV
ncbi:MAG: hypothetical protein CM1200mP30_22820 [Pseudomonadota bacterium]|nr:MAG: hypothetical protein CM1200mP30_22820 [Pseudomonadota bacterium]